MYELYYHPNTASISVHWALVELEQALGIVYKLHLVDFDTSQQKSPEYLRLNPQGRVPTLCIDGAPHTEQAAILLLLAELHPDAALAPSPVSGAGSGVGERGPYLETMTFLANTLLPALRDWVYADKDGEAEGAPAVRRLARRRLEQAWDTLDGRLEGREYLVGDTFGMADVLAGSTVSWTKGVEGIALAEKHGNVRRWVERIRKRPSWEETKRREEGWVVREPPFEKDILGAKL